MSAAQVLGVALIALPFVGFICFAARQYGFTEVAISLALTAATVGCISVGVALLRGGIA